MHDNSRIAVGVAWYRAEEWALLLALIPDPEVFPHTHAEWLARASETFRELSRQGVAVQKVEVEVKALVAWAQAQGRAPDGAARAEYAQHLIAQAAGEQGS